MLKKINSIKKVIIWGYEKNTHTHSYIHESFVKTFKYLGYDTYWFNNSSDISNFDFSNSLFLTSGLEESSQVPIRKDCLYILHNCPYEKFKAVIDKAVMIQVLTAPVFNREGLSKINEYTFISENVIYQPWATDLLPNEINFDWAKIPRKKVINYIGSVLNSGYNDVRNELNRFSEGCVKDGINIHVYGGYTPNTDIGLIKRHSGFISNEKHIQLIKESIYAPQFNGIKQLEIGYIPCRIFKNISYGHMGVTNSKYVNQIFDNQLIYDIDTYQLYFKLKKEISINKTIELMKIVKERHTYINRINQILEYFK